MGTKRIGRVGERDAGFHSNGALPSALSCCHYGSEVFRSCRKQSYGKTCLSWFIYLPVFFFSFSFSFRPIRPSLTSSVRHGDVMWSLWLQAVHCLLSLYVSVSPFIVSFFIIFKFPLKISNQYLCLYYYYIMSFFSSVFLNVPYQFKAIIKWMLPQLCFLLT